MIKMWTFIFSRPQVLVVLQLLSSTWSQDEENFPADSHQSQSQDSSGDASTQEVSCPPEEYLVFTVIPSPPYSTNISGKWDDNQPPKLGLLTYLVQNCDCLLRHRNVSIKVVAGKDELEKMVKANSTDFGFPLFLSTGEESVYKRTYYACASHPGLDLFVIPENPNPGEVVVQTLLSSWPLLALSVILTGIAGIMMWLLEVCYNRDEFPMSFVRGSWEGFWWAFISMTTVGYGDKCPRTIAGRCFSVLWIFAGLILVSVFMANVTTALTSTTYAKKDYRLDGLTVGVLRNSVAESYAKGKGAETKDFTRFGDLIQALKDQDVKGILVDRYVMGYYIQDLRDSVIKTLTRVKYYPTTHLYTFGVVGASQYAEKIMNACFWTDDTNEYSNTVVNKSIIFQGAEYVNGGLRKVKKRSTSDGKVSFNLFLDSKQHFKKVTYISFGVLAGLISIGIMVDMAMRKKKRQTTGEHELKVSEHDQLLQDIRKGKEMLNHMQSFLQKLEENVKKQQLVSPRYSSMNQGF